MSPAWHSGYTESLGSLSRAALQKTTRGLPAYTRYVNRPLGRRVAAASAQTGLTPNHLTSIGTALTFVAIGAIALVPPGLLIGVVVSVLLGVGYVLDSADGPLARLRGGGSPAGEWLDHAIAANRRHRF